MGLRYKSVVSLLAGAREAENISYVAGPRFPVVFISVQESRSPAASVGIRTHDLQHFVPTSLLEA